MRFRQSSFLRGVLLLALAPIASATTWYVNGVSGSNSHNCLSPSTACKTIGHAISLAHSGDSISVAAATYQENLTIGKSLEVIGSGANTTIIDGGAVNRVFTISNGVTVTLARVTIQHGFTPEGGGIYNSGVLMISTSTVSGNNAGGSCSHDCGGAGGGIYNSATGVLMISTSTISGNSAGGSCTYACPGHGGGIYNSATGVLMISTSTVSGNSAGGSCHMHYCNGAGGGIYSDGTLTINNSTLSGNGAFCVGACFGFEGGRFNARGGGLNYSGILAINNSTLSRNHATICVSPGSGCSAGEGGGIYAGGSVGTIQNSIVANSSGGETVTVL